MKQGKLLIADDSEMNRAILANILDRDFELIEVSNGKEALHALQIYHKEISLFLLDIVMPEMDGFEVLKEMRLKGWIKEIPTIMISAETGNTYIDRAFELGAADYISRPFAPSIIRRRIENVLLLYGRAPQLQEVFSESFYQPKRSEKRLADDDPAVSRITKQLEEANSKLDFFNHLCKEMWFEYAEESGKLYLSKGTMERTGLPSILKEPLEHTELAELLGEETIGKLRERLQRITAEEKYLEVPVKVRLSGEVCHCQLVMQILWSGKEGKHFSRLFGKVMEIEPNYKRLQMYGVAVGVQTEKQLLLPVMAGEDDVLHITCEQVGWVMQSYHIMFETVRLIDTEICMQVSTDRKGHIVEKSEHCYSFWGKEERCESCIAQEVIRSRKARSKIETIGNDVYYVLAFCVEVDGRPYALECINSLGLENTNEAENENILNQLIMRNRQVYMDSATQVFNRRYYDDCVKDLAGEYAVALLDIDDFKQVNDRFGHLAGDLVLHRIARTIHAMLRSNDKMIRYGGDEFFILFYGLPEQYLKRKLEDLCQAVRKIELPECPGSGFSISVGGAYALGKMTELFHKADLALYQAKEKKDCVIVWEKDVKE